MKYAPNFATEKLLPGPPYKGCRVASDWCATDIATLGESSRRGDGRIKGKRARTQDLKRGWRAFATQTPPDKNDWPDNGDVRLIHGAMFPDLPDPSFVDTPDFSEVWGSIGEYAVSIALLLSVLPADSPLRKFTSAPHQMVAYETNGDRVHVLDPMHPHSLTYQGVWAPKEHLRKAAKAIPLTLGGAAGGRVIAELYPTGEWTAEALTKDRLQRRIGRIKDNAEKTETRLRARIEALEQQAPPDCDDLIADARAEAHEAAHLASIDWHESQRI